MWRSTPFPKDRNALLRDPEFLFRCLECRGLAAAGSLTEIETTAPPREADKLNHTFLATVSGGEAASLEVVVKSCLLRAPLWLRVVFSLFPSPEYTFYSLVQEHLPEPTDGKPFLAAPKAELALDSRRHSHHFLVLRRIAGNVYTDYDGATRDHAHKFLQAVATMHGHFWGKEDSVLGKQVRQINSAPVALVPKIIFLTPLRRHRVTWDALEACLAASLPGTICHGDCRYGNTLWPTDESDPRVYFLDWEMHMWKDALWDVVYFLWLSVRPKESVGPLEGSLASTDWEYINAWRQRLCTFLPDSQHIPSGPSFETLMKLAQLRYAFFVAVVVAIGAADEWEDNNPLDHQVWTKNIALRQDRLWERELKTGEIAAALDEFSPEHSPWKPRLFDLYQEGVKMKTREIAKRRLKGHAE